MYALIASWHSIRPNFPLLNPWYPKHATRIHFSAPDRPSSSASRSWSVIVPLLFATDSRLDFVASVDDGLEDVDEVAPLVADRVSEAGDIVAVAVAVTPDDVGRNVSCTDDVWIETREVEFVDVLVYADFRREDESAAVGIVERPHRLVKLWRQEFHGTRTPRSWASLPPTSDV